MPTEGDETQQRCVSTVYAIPQLTLCDVFFSPTPTPIPLQRQSRLWQQDPYHRQEDGRELSAGEKPMGYCWDYLDPLERCARRLYACSRAALCHWVRCGKLGSHPKPHHGSFFPPPHTIFFFFFLL